MAYQEEDRVGYETLKSSESDILKACENMVTNVKNMKNSMEDVKWEGSSAESFMKNWDEMTVEVVESAKTQLSTKMRDIIEKWSSEFETTESDMTNNNN